MPAPVASVGEFNAAARPFCEAIGLRPMQVRGYAGGRLLSEKMRRRQLSFVTGPSGPAGPGTDAAGLAICALLRR
ncbi:hypothetical protein ACWFR5_13180 [Streptomyces sp. NPDC055092]